MADLSRKTEMALLMTDMTAAPSQLAVAAVPTQHTVVVIVALIATRVVDGPVQGGLCEIEREIRILDRSAPGRSAKTM
jgi:hypothetical protein